MSTEVTSENHVKKEREIAREHVTSKSLYTTYLFLISCIRIGKDFLIVLNE